MIYREIQLEYIKLMSRPIAIYLQESNDKTNADQCINVSVDEIIQCGKATL